MSKTTQAGMLISQIRQVGGRLFERMLKDAGIDQFNGAQGRILFVLWQQDDLSIAMLSDRTGLAKTTLTSMLERMEACGQLRREPDDRDRRQVRIRLTEETKALYDRYEAVSDRINGVYYRGFNQEEIDSFEEMLRRILKNLKEGER